MTDELVTTTEHGTALPKVDNLIILSVLFNTTIDSLLVVDKGGD